MIVNDLDGNIHYINLAKKKKHKARSKKHIYGRCLLHELFPTCIILEELTIPINRKSKLFLDFFIPMHKIAIEIQGEQHYKFNSFFFDSISDFKNLQARDKLKKEWSLLNDITLIELRYDEFNIWKTQILEITRNKWHVRNY